MSPGFLYFIETVLNGLMSGVMYSGSPAENRRPGRGSRVRIFRWASSTSAFVAPSARAMSQT